MKREFNYTDRKKIKRENVSINFIRQNGVVVAFNVNKIDLNDNDLNLPPHAMVYVEAYYRTELKRFDFGTVDNLKGRSSCDVRDMAYPENLKFRILVVAPSSGKILAQATGISPEEPAERKSVLPVEFSDLGNEIWRVKYEGDGGSPILILNSRIPNIQNIAKDDAQFLIYVYPAVIREILSHMVFVDVDGVDSTTEPSTEWHGDWLKFVRQLGVEIPETLNKENDNNEEMLEWIDACVTAFCNAYSNKFQEYIKEVEKTP